MFPIKVENPDWDNEILTVDRNAHDQIQITYSYTGSSDWDIPMSDDLWNMFVKAIISKANRIFCVDCKSSDDKPYNEPCKGCIVRVKSKWKPKGDNNDCNT